VSARFSQENRSNGAAATKHKSQPQWLACLVDQTAKSSNFFEDLAKLDAYLQSVENDIDALINKKKSDLSS
jgi:hypothetical protein